MLAALKAKLTNNLTSNQFHISHPEGLRNLGRDRLTNQVRAAVQVRIIRMDFRYSLLPLRSRIGHHGCDTSRVSLAKSRSLAHHPTHFREAKLKQEPSVMFL